MKKIEELISQNPKVAALVTAVLAFGAAYIVPAIKFVAPMVGLTCQ